MATRMPGLGRRVGQWPTRWRRSKTARPSPGRRSWPVRSILSARSGRTSWTIPTSATPTPEQQAEQRLDDTGPTDDQRRPRPDAHRLRPRSPGASAPTSWASSTSRRTRSRATGCWREGRSHRPPSSRRHRSPDGRRGRRPPRHRRRIHAAGARARRRGQEIARVVPVITAVAAALPGVPLSVDTTKPAVAEAALAAGAHLLNDVWATGPGGRDDGRRGRRGGGSPRPDAQPRRGALRPSGRGRGADRPGRGPRTGGGGRRAGGQDSSSTRASASARPPTTTSRCCATSGRSATGPSRPARHLAQVHAGPHPRPAGRGPRLEATLATTALGIAAGVDIVRVHDVHANVRAARVTDAIVRGHWRAETAEGADRERPDRAPQHAVPAGGMASTSTSC